ncbi:MAG: nucleotide exchange factor GrpE [Ruminococcaceae bacterium]|nr:nucleotide exchange factor GrpE [Oscillospiraceae bacterium]
MSKKKEETPVEEVVEETLEQTDELAKKEAELAAKHEQYLLLAAEFDNFRKRTQREKDAIYNDGVADTAKKLLPIYDNLLRALNTETTDEAYKKGIEMVMNELLKTLEGMNIVPFGQVGDAFDPEKHNAVMHCEDETLGENAIAEVFQKGFSMADKIIRFAMVKVSN